jgi:hypothetical protein
MIKDIFLYGFSLAMIIIYIICQAVLGAVPDDIRLLTGVGLGIYFAKTWGKE